MTTLRISLFGTVKIAHDDWSPNLKITPKAQELLCYLLIKGMRSHVREILVNRLWGDYSERKGRGCLSTTLWRLRNVLEPKNIIPPGTFLLTPTASEIGFNWDSNYWLDVAEFEDQTNSIMAHSPHLATEADIQTLESSLQLYSGDLLEGFYYDWVLREQERLRALYLDCLEYLMRYYRYRRMYEISLTYCQRILAYEPIREDIHRDLMRLHLENGQRTLAIRQYELCANVLADELDLSPVEETQQLYWQAINSPEPPISSKKNLDLSEAIAQLCQTAKEFEIARQQLDQAKRRLDKFQQQLQQTLHLVERLNH